MKTIVVTGVPGTGKTTLAKNLAKRLNFLYIDVNKLISKHKLSEGYDRKRKTKIIDINKLVKFLISEIKNFKKFNLNKKFSLACERVSFVKSERSSLACHRKFFNGIIIDSHLSHYLPRKYVDFCIVTKCDIKELNKRLKKKRFHQNKRKENIQAEIFDICYNEALERKHKILVINTTKGFNINEIIKKLSQSDNFLQKVVKCLHKE